MWKGFKMNIRQIYILKYLLKHSKSYITYFKVKFNVSERTVRNDLESIQIFLKNKYQKDRLVITNVDVNLKLFESEKDEIEDLLNQQDYYQMKMNPYERQMIIIFDLLSMDTKVRIQDLMDKYYVSRTTINNDLIEIKQWCKKRNVPLSCIKGQGIYVNINENKRRKYLIELIKYFSNNEYQQDVIYTELFNDLDLEGIKQIIFQNESKYNHWLSDMSFDSLVIHIALSIKRYAGNNKSEINEFKNIPNIESKLYKMAEDIIQSINNIYDLKLPNYEIVYIAIHLSGQPNSSLEEMKNIDSLIELFALQMISVVSDQLECDLKNDKRLYWSLIQHLQASRVRFLNSFKIVNPLKVELLTTYPAIYQILSDFIRNKKNSGFILDNEDEISYILLYFAAAVDRKKRKKSKNIMLVRPNVIIVCATGLGTSELVSSRLINNLNINILQCVGLYNLESALRKSSVDLVISTIPIQIEIPHIQVSPMIDQVDILNIKRIMLELGFTPWSTPGIFEECFSKIMVQYYSDMNNETLIGELNNLYEQINQSVLHDNTEIGEFKLLSELLTDETILLDCNANDWQDGIRQSGFLLVENGYITNDYIEECIKSVIEFGPYIVITKHVALSHASNNKGVIKTGLSLVRLVNPVEFGNENNDPVRFIFTLATVNASEHLIALSDLSEFLGECDFIELLNQMLDKRELLRYISENETKREVECNEK